MSKLKLKTNERNSIHTVCPILSYNARNRERIETNLSVIQIKGYQTERLFKTKASTSDSYFHSFFNMHGF